MGIHNTFIASFPQPKSLRIDDDGDDTDDECISPYTLPTAATHADTELAYMSTNAEDAAATIDDLLNDPIVMDHVMGLLYPNSVSQ